MPPTAVVFAGRLLKVYTRLVQVSDPSPSLMLTVLVSSTCTVPSVSVAPAFSASTLKSMSWPALIVTVKGLLSAPPSSVVPATLPLTTPLQSAGKLKPGTPAVLAPLQL